MNWLFLTPAEFTALFSIGAVGAVWLYLLHRRPQRRIVSTLKFWTSIETAAPPQRRRRLQEPWALLAQLLFLLLVLLALANPLQPGRSAPDRPVVMLVDMSVWSQAQPPGQTPWAERVRSEALRLLDRLAPGDNVLLLRADGEGAPVLPFTQDRAAVRRAIAGLQPSDTVADLPRSLEFAAAAAVSPNSMVIYVGPGIVDEPQAARLERMQNAFRQGEASGRPRLIVRRVGNLPLDNRGITRLALRRDPAQPERWHLLTQVRNYASHPAAVDLRITVDGHPIHQEALSVGAGEMAGARTEFSWADGGVLRAEISPPDALAADDRAVSTLPVFHPVRVAVFSADPKVLQPVLAANPYVRTEFVRPGQQPVVQPDVAIYDAVRPPAAPSSHAIFFLPGGDARELRVTAWNPQHPVSRWIRTRDISVRSSSAFATQPSDAVLAWSNGRPLIVAREQDGHKIVLLGFDPRHSNFPLQPAFPLLLAAAMEWMTGSVEELADALPSGPVEVRGAAEQVVSSDGNELPFAREDDRLEFLANRTGIYRLRSGSAESRLAVNLPPLPVQQWKIEDDDADLDPPPLRPPKYLWRMLVLLATLPLWAEWLLFYPRRRSRLAQDDSNVRRAA